MVSTHPQHLDTRVRLLSPPGGSRTMAIPEGLCAAGRGLDDQGRPTRVGPSNHCLLKTLGCGFCPGALCNHPDTQAGFQGCSRASVNTLARLSIWSHIQEPFTQGNGVPQSGKYSQRAAARAERSTAQGDPAGPSASPPSPGSGSPRSRQVSVAAQRWASARFSS